MTIEESLFYGDKNKNLKSIEFQLLMLVEHIITAQYIWENLPSEIDIDLPERTLFYFGQALYWGVGDHRAMSQTVGQGTVDMYGRFTKYRPIIRGSSFDQLFTARANLVLSKNSAVKVDADAVLVRNNEQNIPTLYLVLPVIKRLASLWVTMGMKQALSRVKCLIQANEGSAKAIKQALRAIIESDDLFPVISDKRSKSKGAGILSELQTFQVYGEYDPTKDWYDFDKTWNLLMTMCGVSSNNQQNKKERIIVAEAESNDAVVELVGDMPKRLREEAVKQINEIFHSDIKVTSKAEMEQQKAEKKQKELVESQPKPEE